MKKANMGWLLIALGTLTLSVELFILSVIKYLDFMIAKSTVTIVAYIFSMPNCLLGMLLDIAVIIMGVVLIRRDKRLIGTDDHVDN